jgi:hypothetical protein
MMALRLMLFLIDAIENRPSLGVSLQLLSLMDLVFSNPLIASFYYSDLNIPFFSIIYKMFLLTSRPF